MRMRKTGYYDPTMQQELAFIVLCALLCIATAAPLDVAPDDEDDAAESASSSELIEALLVERDAGSASTSTSTTLPSNRNSPLENANLFEGDLNITQDLIDRNYGVHLVSLHIHVDISFFVQ